MKLTPKTRQVYEALYELTSEQGHPPSIRQLVSHLNSHIYTVFSALQVLVDLQLVEKRNPINTGIYIPVLPPNKVDWETLGGNDERKSMEAN